MKFYSKLIEFHNEELNMSLMFTNKTLQTMTPNYIAYENFYPTEI